MIDLVDDSEIKKKYHKKKYRKYTREQLVEKLQEWVKENGRIPKEIDFINNPKYPGYTTYQIEFGTWNSALIATGLEINKKYSREQLTEKMQEWVNENGRLPGERDFINNPKYPCFDTYQREFGTWNNALIATGFEPNNTTVARARQGELQTISETKGAIDLSGKNRLSTCDGICSEGPFDTKSASLSNVYDYWGWHFAVTIDQLEEAKYLFLRAYEDKDFTKSPLHKWRIPIEFMDNRIHIFINKDPGHGLYNVENMKEYEI